MKKRNGFIELMKFILDLHDINYEEKKPFSSIEESIIESLGFKKDLDKNSNYYYKKEKDKTFVLIPNYDEYREEYKLEIFYPNIEDKDSTYEVEYIDNLGELVNYFKYE